MENRASENESIRMNQDILAGQWRQLRGSLKSWWGKLTDDDINRIAGEKDRLISMLQEKYGYARDMAAREVERRLKEYNEKSSHTMQQSTGNLTNYGGTAENVAQTARNIGESNDQSASQRASNGRDQEQEAGSGITQKVSNAYSSLSEGVSSAADTIRQNIPSSETVGSAMTAVANQVDAASTYFQENSFENMLRDVTALVRRYPLQSLMVGLGIGFL